MNTMIKKVIETEVLVVGGGGAGITAAIGAARNGAKTFDNPLRYALCFELSISSPPTHK